MTIDHWQPFFYSHFPPARPRSTTAIFQAASLQNNTFTNRSLYRDSVSVDVDDYDQREKVEREILGGEERMETYPSFHLHQKLLMESPYFGKKPDIRLLSTWSW